MIKIEDIYVGTTLSLLQLIFCRCINNSQHYVLANPDFNNLPIEKYKREMLQTFMSKICLFVTISLTLIYLEVIANIYIIGGG